MNSRTLTTLPPLIESFAIVGLNGYKTIRVGFERNVKVVAAENGSGKTTLLNTLHSLLTQKYRDIAQLDFESLIIKFSNSEALELKKSDFAMDESDFSNLLKHSTAAQDMHRYGLDREDIELAIANISRMGASEFMETDEFQNLWRSNTLGKLDTFRIFTDVFESTLAEHSKLSEITEYVKNGLGETRVMYLPTYRRIEAIVPEYKGRTDEARRTPRIPSRLGRKSASSRIVEDWDLDKLIYFGLSDVEEKLNSITNEIRRGTAAAYSRISGKTLDQLLSTGNIDSSLGDDLNIQNLKVILARLGKSDAESRLSALIETDEIDKATNKYLKSFLGQMLEIYRETQDQELAIEQFVSLVESYWDQNVEEKHLTYDKLAVEVKISNIYTGKQLGLNDLSSGEKQMISVFARLYLNPDVQYLILIDEPELSLSIDWQRKFLPDIFRSPSCAQLVAITHSPYIFENELDVCAGALDVSFKRTDD